MVPADAFELDPVTKEPFLRLPEPRSNIIITPPRHSDAEAAVIYLNDPLVYPYLIGPPYPYLLSDSISWMDGIIKSTQLVWTEVLAASNSSEGTPVFGGSPVRSIRQINEDGSQTFLGDCGIDRWGYVDVLNKDEKDTYTEINNKRDVGDPEVVWTFGDYIAGSHHGRGIMSAVVGTIMTKWAIPWMNAKHIKTTAFLGNVGSKRVFEKNDYKLVETIEDHVEFPASKGGGRRGSWIFEWKLDD